MNTPPGILTPAQWDTLSRLAAELSPRQLDWVSGYLAGHAAARQVGVPLPAPPATGSAGITVLFGSQTGNAEKIAKVLHDRLQQAGHAASLESMARYKPARLKKDACLLVVASTHGEGEPPDSARGFHEFLHGRKPPRLEHLSYAVLALGDASYEHFCKTGRDFDGRLEELGARRLHPRVDCDVDYEEPAEAWIEAVVAALPSPREPRVEACAPATAGQSSAYSKKRPFLASLLENLRLTGRDSTKDVRHIELSLADSGLAYAPGDALGVAASNWPERVAELLEALDFDPEAPVPGRDGSETGLWDALLHHYEISPLTRPVLEKYAACAEAKELAELLKEENRARLRDYLHGREVIDLVQDFPLPGLSPSDFVGLLRKLPPRLYSIASSLAATPGEAHLTVGVVRYERHGRKRQGVASTFLADRLGEAETVPVYVESNPNFRLPTDPGAPIVMVGPGTGVAPFRAFLAEREATGATGKNWLFFGDRSFHSDFLYQTEWLDHRRNGLLDRIDVAFSRDGADKVYVQRRMLENSRDLYAWLEEGAHFYVCGDAGRMVPDVHEALVSVVEKESGQGRERALAYVEELRTARRYQRDVY